MNEDKNFILYEWNNETKEFYFLGHKIDYIHNPSEWRKYLNDLVTENKKLQQRIDKAIEYIEYIEMDQIFDKVLIEILKGEDNE